MLTRWTLLRPGLRMSSAAPMASCSGSSPRPCAKPSVCQKERKTMEQKNNFDIKKVKVHRTVEGNIFETVFAIVAIVVWGIIIWLIHQAPDIVPTHFDGSGNPNSYGSPASVAIPCIILTIAAIGCMVVAYFPRLINSTVKITNIRQVELNIRSIRVAGITLLLMALAVAYTMLGMNAQTPFPILAVVVLLLVEILIFSILTYKAR